MKHWTLQLADEYRESGFKYAIFDRRSKGDGYHKGINDLQEMYGFLDMAYSTNRFSNEKPRVALSPGYDETEFMIMWYPEDGTYWCKGKVIIL